MRKNLWLELAAGVAGGLLGTELMQTMMKRAGKMPPSLRPPAPAKNPAEFMVEKAERLAHRELPPGIHRAAVKSMPWAYGTVWPFAFSLVANRLGWRSAGRLLAAGAGLGALVWAIGSLGWLPATGLSPGVHRQAPGRVAANLIGHLAYGALSTVPLAALHQI